MNKWSPEQLALLTSKMNAVETELGELKLEHPEGIHVVVPANVAVLLGVAPGQEPTDIVELLV